MLELSDLFQPESKYVSAISREIKAQMAEQNNAKKDGCTSIPFRNSVGMTNSGVPMLPGATSYSMFVVPSSYSNFSGTIYDGSTELSRSDLNSSIYYYSGGSSGSRLKDLSLCTPRRSWRRRCR